MKCGPRRADLPAGIVYMTYLKSRHALRTLGGQRKSRSQKINSRLLHWPVAVIPAILLKDAASAVSEISCDAYTPCIIFIHLVHDDSIMYLYSMTGIKDLKLLACFNFNFFSP